MTWYLSAYYSGKSAGKRCGVQIVVIEALRGLELENLNERCGYRQGDAEKHEGCPRRAHADEGHGGPQEKSEGVVCDGDDYFAVQEEGDDGAEEELDVGEDGDGAGEGKAAQAREGAAEAEAGDVNGNQNCLPQEQGGGGVLLGNVEDAVVNGAEAGGQ